MRAINIGAAANGVVALAMLVLAAHALRDNLSPEALTRIQLGAFLQMFAACAGLALANRSGALNLIGAALILSGAAVFAATLYAISLTGNSGLAMAAPIGGIAMIAGWGVIAFAKP
ncbi:hypothetical protein U91I_01229 [alpha proteobacterium U9-1i]|nr:hypothetical protein U91I_01229 [alpha proteobacterium U9-1i]